MKALPFALAVLLLSACDSGPKFRNPVAVVAHADATQAGSKIGEGAIEPGDTVDLSMPFMNIDGDALVTLRNGKRGYVPVTALALPDSLKTKN